MEALKIITKIPDWDSETEAREILNLKQTALWKLRKSGAIRYSKIGDRTYYKIDSIMQLLEDNLHERYNSN